MMKGTLKKVLAGSLAMGMAFACMAMTAGAATTNSTVGASNNNPTVGASADPAPVYHVETGSGSRQTQEEAEAEILWQQTRPVQKRVGFVKVAEDTQEVIPGVRYMVKTPAGDVVAEFTTGQGAVYVNLTNGVYTIEEDPTTVPEGFGVMDPMEVQIIRDNYATYAVRGVAGQTWEVNNTSDVITLVEPVVAGASRTPAQSAPAVEEAEVLGARRGVTTGDFGMMIPVMLMVASMGCAGAASLKKKN